MQLGVVDSKNGEIERFRDRIEQCVWSLFCMVNAKVCRLAGKLSHLLFVVVP